MGGSSVKKPLGDTLKNSLVMDVADGVSRVGTGGLLSLSNKGILQQDQPFKGNNVAKGYAGTFTGGMADKMYYDPKVKAEKLTEEAKRAAGLEQADLLNKANNRKTEEEAQKSALDDLAQKKAQQLKKSKGAGRQSTIVTGQGAGDTTLGSNSTGKTLLGL